VFLAAVGVFGVLSYVVSARTREIGIRMALGARRRTIFRDVLAAGGSLVAIGSVLGLAGGVALTRWTLIPARRATRVNPVIALRS